MEEIIEDSPDGHIMIGQEKRLFGLKLIVFSIAIFIIIAYILWRYF